MFIPKIIHQLAPSNIFSWHPLWIACQESWKKHFLGFEYKLWNDEDIDILIEQHYSQYYQVYQEFPIHIMKIDFVRFAILHKFGGIYADMDVFCYQNFYNEINETDCYVVENPYGNDPIENSLMASVSDHNFWIQCMDLSVKRFEEIKKKNYDLINFMQLISNNEKVSPIFRPALVFHITGTNLISTVYRKNMNTIGTLSGHIYNNNDMSYHPEYRTKHIHTGLWGQEDIKIEQQTKKNNQSIRKSPINEFDFYTDYSNGNYLKQREIDIYKNSYENTLYKSNIKYQ